MPNPYASHEDLVAHFRDLQRHFLNRVRYEFLKTQAELPADHVIDQVLNQALMTHPEAPPVGIVGVPPQGFCVHCGTPVLPGSNAAEHLVAGTRTPDFYGLVTLVDHCDACAAGERCLDTHPLANGAKCTPLEVAAAMALSHSTKQKNGTLDGTAPVATAYDSGGAIRFYSGSVPASGDAAEGTILCTQNLPTDVFPAVSGGVLTANAIGNATISSTGTVTCFRIVASGDTGALVTTTQPRIQGTVGTSAADFIVNTTSFVAAATLTTTALSYTHPA